MIRILDIANKCILGCALATGMLFPFSGARASGIKLLYTFCSDENCTDGANPWGGLITDSAGNFYGTTEGGGKHGHGTVFRIAPSHKETVLYSFKGGADGAVPMAGLTADHAGNFYGTTWDSNTCDGNSCGTVFKLAPDGTETVLHHFTGQANGGDGDGPQGDLIIDSGGNLYGTTYTGGAEGNGAVFKVTPSGSETVLYSFQVGTDGAHPVAGLIAGGEGNLYGTTEAGGSYHNGTVFKLIPSSQNGIWTEAVLYSFCSKPNCKDGSAPLAGLIADAQGNLYGTTQQGGKDNAGTVFKLAPDGSETVLHTFCSGPHCNGGSSPEAGLIADIAGNLYGTTNSSGPAGSCGTVFMLAPNNDEKVLHTFYTNAPACSPTAGLIIDTNGNLYGTSFGSPGTVFRLKE